MTFWSEQDLSDFPVKIGGYSELFILCILRYIIQSLFIMATAFAKLVTKFSKDTVLIPTEIGLCLGYDIGYIGVYEEELSITLYIQLASGKISPRTLYKKLDGFGEIISNPDKFKKFEGELVDEIGVFRKHGGNQSLPHLILSNPPDNPPPPKKSVMSMDRTSLEVLARAYRTHVERSKKVPKRAPDEIQFAPVYAGHGNVWGICGWIPVREKCKGKKMTPLEESFLFEKQGGKCAFCKSTVSKGDVSNSDADHIIPLSIGGNNSMSNRQILCVPCHRKKTGLETKKRRIGLEDFYKVQDIIF